METKNKVIQRERFVRIIFFILLHILILTVILSIPYMLVSSVLAIVTFYLLFPVVEFLQFKGLPRHLAATIPFVTIAVLFFVLASEFLPILSAQFSDLLKLGPTYFESLKELIAQLEKRAQLILIFSGQSNLSEQIQGYLLVRISSFMKQLPTIFSGAMTTLFLTPFFSYFLLVDGGSLYRNFLKLVPNHIFETMIRVNHEIHQQMGQFIRARLLESFIVGAIIYFGLTLINFPYSMLLALFAAILNLVPYVGPLIGALPAVILTYVSPEAQGHMGAVLILYTLGQVVDTVFIVPFVVAKIVNLHPVAVVIAVLLGAQIMGILGMIISIPLMSALKIFSAALYNHLTRAQAK